MVKANQELRERMRRAGILQWQLALEIGISAPTLLIWLRVPLEGERKQRVYEALERMEREAK